jgi:hypothetical protein
MIKETATFLLRFLGAQRWQPSSPTISGRLGSGCAVVSLYAADKSPRLTCRLSQGQKGLDERALIAFQRSSEPW